MDILYELWLHSVCSFEPDMANKLSRIFGDTGSKFREIKASELKELGIPRKIADNYLKAEYYKRAQKIYDHCADNGIRIITPENEEYPEGLRNITLPPRILFVKGQPLSGKDEPMTAVVGCRKPTSNGREAARKIGRSLAKNGITVVGGMAEGIDGEAHHGALSAGGRTIAVLAGGVEDVYPASNRKLYNEILKNGTVVSERPHKTAVRKYFYRQRNRIMVGLCQSVVIVEGKLESGTSMTAGIATDENRDIIAVPGNPVCWQSTLPNSLITDGAEIATTVDRPAEYMKENYPYLDFGGNSVEEEPANKVETGKCANPTEAKILEYLDEVGRVATNDEIALNCEIPQAVLSSTLTMLCIKGKIRQESGSRYVLII